MGGTKSRAPLAALALLALLAWILWMAARPDRDGSPSSPVSGQPGSESGQAPSALGANPKEAPGRLAVPAPPRRVELLLRRYPDDARLDVVAVQVDPPSLGARDAWLTTDGGGRLELELPPDVSTLTVRAGGYLPSTITPDPTASSVELALTPRWGLFGRVLREDGTPAPGVAVEAQAIVRIATNLEGLTRERPEVPVKDSVAHHSSTTTNAGGFYYLDCETRLSGPAIRVVARSPDQKTASRVVDVPREPELLDDLVVSTAPVLTVRVVDEAGLPIAGATVFSWMEARREQRILTSADGTRSFVDPSLPAAFAAQMLGHLHVATRFDGVSVDRFAKVPSTDTKVEITLLSTPGVHVRLVDGETGLPLARAHISTEMFLEEARAGSFDCGVDQAGEGWIPTMILKAGGDASEPADRLQLRIQAQGYVEQSLSCDLPWTGTAPMEIQLQPDLAFTSVRGRILRGGIPVAHTEIGMRLQSRSEGRSPKHGNYIRATSGPDGRFVLRWRRDPKEDVVVIHPHWVRWDEFAFLGPMSIEEATSRELVLEVHPAVRVPAVLRNVVRSDRYRYYVSIEDEQVTIGTTVNGAPIHVDTDGEARTTLLLPSHRRASVTIGYTADSYSQPNASLPVQYDPDRRTEPLIFDVQSLFARVAGRVSGFSAEELARVGVGYEKAGDPETRIVPVGPSGEFEFPAVLLGGGTLLLLQDGAPGRVKVLARMPIHVESDVEGVVLGPDPSSLPGPSQPRR